MIINDFYKDFEGISKGILRRFNGILKGFLNGLHKDGFYRIVLMILREFL